ncbi:hypothetical protein AXF42_Ash017331 [Apostasia shenzhenica]|uniref:Uncharacterized protein n=1 Tax=Apostasia shenzhenica TaxID=1088818 RepID=A0A2I0BDH0_9ASPA|nr:hypothetical protein AXF42_Ash017331 [Apostasia shenzhenica]
MARILSQTLIRESQTLCRDLSPLGNVLCGIRSSGIPRPPSSRLFAVRLRSGLPEVGQLLEIDLGPASENANVEVEVIGLGRLEDAIRGLVVQKSAPGWLPFAPGSSYWVPPKPRGKGLGVLDLLGPPAKLLTKEEVLSRNSERGWPSSSYYVDGKISEIPSSLCIYFPSMSS